MPGCVVVLVIESPKFSEVVISESMGRVRGEGEPKSFSPTDRPKIPGGAKWRWDFGNVYIN